MEGLRKTLGYCRAETLKIILIVVLKLLAVVMAVYQPLIYSGIINALTKGAVEDIYYGLLRLVCVQLVQILSGYAAKVLDIKAAKNINYYVKSKVLQYIFGIPNYYNDLESGRLHSLIVSDANSAYAVVATLISACLSVLNVIGAGVVSIMIDWRMSLLLLIPYPIIIILNKVFSKKMRSAAHCVLEQNDKFISILRNVLGNIGNIQRQEGSRTVTQKILEEAEQGKDLSIKQGQVQNLFGFLVNATDYASYIILTCAGIVMVVKGQLTLGGFIAFNTYSKSLSNSIEGLINLKTNVQPLFISMNRVYELQDNYNKYQDTEEKKEKFSGTVEQVQLRNIAFGYNGKEVLKNINLTIKKGEIIGIVGKNGTGKTTVSKIISRVLLPESGDVLFNGTECSRFNYFSIISHISYVSNRKDVYYLSIRDNIMLGKTNGIEEYNEICNELGIDEDLRKLDLNDEAEITDFFELSTGQMQKIQLARMFVKDCELLILDEAFSGLDDRTKNIVKYKLKQMASTKLIIIISHVGQDYDICDKIYQLDGGRLLEIKETL